MIYTKDNPKLVSYYDVFIEKQNFTGVVKSKYSTFAYYVNGELHREDGPAVEWADGEVHWILHGLRYGKDEDFTNESWIRFVKLELLK